MRACTAALIELRHEESEKAAPEYRGEVEFLSQAEWDKERLPRHTLLATPSPDNPSHSYTLPLAGLAALPDGLAGGARPHASGRE